MLSHGIMGNGNTLVFIGNISVILNLIDVLRFHSGKTCTRVSQHYFALFESTV